MKMIDKLFYVLTSQREMLEKIHYNQRFVKKAVNERNWQNLEQSLYRIQCLSDEFVILENERIFVFESFGCSQNNDIYHIVSKLPKEKQKDAMNLFHEVRQKLMICKIENNSINEYIKITKEFLQGIFDKVVPQRKNVIYGISGVIKNQPTSLVLDAVL
ncbi:MAG: hypothetical protein GX220_03200 [Treponema sp.]|nr:hypothetical protein [Treponema sp.]